MVKAGCRLPGSGTPPDPYAAAKVANCAAWSLAKHGRGVGPSPRRPLRRTPPRTCAVQTLRPVDAAGLWTTTRTRPQTMSVRSVVVHSPWTTAHRDGPIRQYAVVHCAHRPCDREEFFGFRRETARASHTPPPPEPVGDNDGVGLTSPQSARRSRDAHIPKLVVDMTPLRS